MIDIKQNSEGDLDLSSGDIVFANEYDATEQHKADILMASQGDYAESPLTGVDFISYLNDQDNGDMLRDISLQMQRDGITIIEIKFDTQNGLLIDGSYENNNDRA